MTPASGAARRVVIYRLGSLGDTVVALPCLHAVAKAFPDAERIMLTNFPVSSKAAPLEAILGGSGLVHRFIAYPIGTRSFRALRELRATLRALGADTLVYLTPARGLRLAWRDWLYFKWCGFEHIIGAPVTPDLQHNRRGPDGLIEWECERLARCVAPLGQVALHTPGAWDLRLTAAERLDAAGLLQRLLGRPRIAVNMGGKVAGNDWGEANWTALVRRLHSVCPDHALLFIGATEDAERAERVGAAWGGTFVNLCGKVSPRVSAAAMQGSRLFVGHDSGPLHLAACMSVICVGLYGNHNEPRRWHPYGHGHWIIHDMQGVLAIGVEDVVQAVTLQLASQGGSAPAARQTAQTAQTAQPAGISR